MVLVLDNAHTTIIPSPAMGKIARTVHVAHDKGQQPGGLLHYVTAASNQTAKGYRRGVRGRDLYRLAVHRTGVYRDGRGDGGDGNRTREHFRARRA